MVLFFFLFLFEKMSGRKRKYAGEDWGMGRKGMQVYDGRVVSKYKRRKVTQRPFRVGRDRVGGFYGRYSGRGGELKFHDLQLDDAAIATGGESLSTGTLIVIPQGVTEKTRVGRKCTIKSINWHYVLTLAEADATVTPPPADSVRLIMYIDKQTNGATAPVTQILETANYQSFRNLANSGRFEILFDKTHSMNRNGLASDNAGVVSSNGTRRDGTFYKKCNLPIEYNSTTGVIAEIRSNNIGLLVISFAGVTSMVSKIRMRFSDS